MLALHPRHSETQAREVRRITLWGLALNLALALLKFVFGVVGASQALVADAVHSLSDSATDVAVLIGAPYWSAPADADHPYGHQRIETMITAVIGVLLGAVGVGLIYRTLATMQAPHDIPPGWTAFAVACISIVAKEALYRWTFRVGKRIKSSAVMANAWHHRSDGMSSVPVALAVLGTRLRPDWSFLDHLGALVVSVLILQVAWKIVWPALNQLADAGASEQERVKLRGLVVNIEGVRAVHAFRTRRLGFGLQVDLHVLVDPLLSVRAGHDIARDVKQKLREEGPDILDVLVHVEPYEEPSGKDA